MAERKILTPEERKWRAETEAQFQSWVRAVAKRGGCALQHHNSDSRKYVKGVGLIGDKEAKDFPDLVFIAADVGWLVVAELKTMRGTVEPGQQAWIDGFRACGIPAFIWRPCDRSEVIENLMTIPMARRRRGGM